MNDSLSNVSHIVICAADMDPDKIKPLLQDRNDALDYLSVGEDVLEDLSYNKKPHPTDTNVFKREDSDKLEAALAVLKKDLLGERDQFGDQIKPPVSLNKIKETRAAFEKALEELSYQSRQHVRTKMFHKEDGREERLEKSFEAYMQQLANGPYRKTPSKPTKELKPTIEDPKAWTYHGLGESEKGGPSSVEETKEKWEKPTVEPEKEYTPYKLKGPVETPKIRRVPTRDTDKWFRVEPAISELMNLPKGKDAVLGEGAVDNLLLILDKNPSLDEFMEQAYRVVPNYYHHPIPALEERIKQLQEKITSAPESYQPRLKNALVKAEDKLKHIQTLNTNLKFLHKNWTEMENKSSLIKNISDNYRLILGDREITLSTTWLDDRLFSKLIVV